MIWLRWINGLGIVGFFNSRLTPCSLTPFSIKEV